MKKEGQATDFPCLPIQAPHTGRNSNQLMENLKVLNNLESVY